ncbi:hypothetical protein [Nocardia lasii]|uniref:WXG100 family type VII secretion target n=1 Tax=Nocardia lasii TaxID=1616107 RepID=A0ABW1JXX8_9NOCA
MSIEFEYGQAEISAFTESARAGVFSFDEAAVKAVVSSYDTMIQDLTALRVKFDKAQNVSGFGGFPSAAELERGFATKATDGISMLAKFMDAAMQMQEGLLRAAGQVTEADELSKRRIAALGREVTGRS